MKKLAVEQTDKRSKDKAAAEIKRLWGDTPVTDASRELRVIVQPCDLQKATAKDPGHCVFAQACKRSLGAKKVLFLRTVAYVELPTEDGRMQVERFELSAAMRDLITNFDKGNDVLPKAGFYLKPPSPSNTLDAKVERDRKGRSGKKKTSLLHGKNVDPSKSKPSNRGKDPHKSMVLVDVEVRNGKGLVHFTGSAAS